MTPACEGRFVVLVGLGCSLAILGCWTEGASKGSKDDPGPAVVVVPPPTKALEETKAAARGQSIRWAGCDITRKAFMNEIASAFEAKTGVTVELGGGGATAGIRRASAGTIDVGGTCRHPIPIDREKDVRLIPVAWDALVVIVHPSNPIEAITAAQVRGVLRGDLSSWSELGGPKDETIKLLVREGVLSGVGRMTRELLFHDPDVGYANDAIVFSSSGPLETKVETDPLTFAVAGISSARRRKVRVIPIGDVEPTYENIASGAYGYVRPLYLVLSQHPERDRTRHQRATELVAFTLSDEGQAIVKRAGTVNLEDGAGLWTGFRQTMVAAGVGMGLY